MSQPNNADNTNPSPLNEAAWALRLHNVSVHYANRALPAVKNLNLQLKAGEIACLLGASGCGKSSVLRAIAGFVDVQGDTASISSHGRILADTWSNTHIPPERRRVGMMFQDLALFPHLSVADNVAYGLQMQKTTKAEKNVRVAELLSLVGLSADANMRVGELSGGQQQRVALARALAPRPEILLLDEPFSSLDALLRQKLTFDVRNILKAEGVTALLVTHDQHEAFAFADWVGVMRAGQMEQWAAPYTLYHEPVTRYVAEFIGEGTFLRGTATLDSAQQHQHVHIELGDITPADAPHDDHSHLPSMAVDVLLRPDDVVHDDASPVTAVVVRKAFRGAEFLYTLRLNSGAEVLALVPSHHDHAVGEAIGIRLEADHVVTFAVDSIS